MIKIWWGFRKSVAEKAAQCEKCCLLRENYTTHNKMSKEKANGHIDWQCLEKTYNTDRSFKCRDKGKERTKCHNVEAGSTLCLVSVLSAS